MSLHARISAEAAIKLRKQLRQSRVLSIVMACLVVLLMAGLLALFALPMMTRETPVIVTYHATIPEDQTLQEKKVMTQTQRKPSAPAQHMAKVIAADTAAPTAIPVPDIQVTEPSLHFGDDFDFGEGWGDDIGMDGGAASFFGQQVLAKRIAYVIDYSLSMRGKREELMREELANSIEALPPGMQYQLIFFAGPAWVAGDAVKVSQGNKQATVTAGSKTYAWFSKTNAHGWEVKDPKKVQQPEWLDVTSNGVKKSLQQIKETKLVWGTVWQPPVEMALRMDPPPQIIYFMTDGLTGGNPVQAAEKIAKLARDKKVIINTVTLMEPRAREAMITMAEQTGGQATLINEKGEQKPLKSK